MAQVLQTDFGQMDLVPATATVAAITTDQSHPCSCWMVIG